MTDDKTEAIQAVVDRVTSYQDGAEERVVETELRDGFREVGVDVSDADVRRLADAIDSADQPVSAAEVLG
jgi:hypothetical protein